MAALSKIILFAALAAKPIFGASLPTRDTTAANHNGCVSGAHIIVARASTETPGTGIIGAVALNVSAQVPNSDIVAVDYPATLTNYTSSEGAGTLAMAQLLTSYQKKCPGHRIVLMGYSQGAQVTADTICGTSEAGFNATKGASGEGGKLSLASLPCFRR
jgi:acetylxylan esterase